MVASLRGDRPALVGCWLLAIHSFVTAFSTYITIRDVLQTTENSSTVVFALCALSAISLLIALLPCGLLLLYFLKPSREQKRANLVAAAFFIMAANQLPSLVLNLLDRSESIDLLSLVMTVAYAAIYLVAGIDARVNFKWQYLSCILLCLRVIVPILSYGKTLYILFSQGSDVLPTLGSAAGALLLPIGLVLLTLSFKKTQTA